MSFDYTLMGSCTLQNLVCKSTRSQGALGLGLKDQAVIRQSFTPFEIAGPHRGPSELTAESGRLVNSKGLILA